MSPLSRLVVAPVLRPMLLSWGAITGLGLALFAAQALTRAPVLPSPVGALWVLLGLLPAVAAVGLPVSVLFGVVAAAERKAREGEWLALAASGLPARRLVPPLLVLGLVGGIVEAGLTHGLEPMGRATVRRALEGAVSELRLQPGQPAVIGELLLLAGGVEGPRMTDLFVAVGDTALAARGGRMEAGVLVVTDGEAEGRGAGGGASLWSLTFERARLPLAAGGLRVEAAERDDRALLDLIDRMEAKGRRADFERMTLYKRSALPLSVPLLTLLGLPLGARRARPALVAAATVLGWWVLMRLSDQSVSTVGALLASGLPPAVLAIAALVGWSRWGAR